MAATISNISAPDSATLYNKFEVTFDVDTAATNLYWPYDADPPSGVNAGVGVSVDALFSNDGWATTLTKPCFYYQPYEYINRPSFGEWIYPNGNPYWCARFSPYTIGNWQYKLRVTDSNGTTTTDAASFVCNSSSNHGPLRVSPTDFRYFEHADGTPWICGIGLSDNDYGNLVSIETNYPDLGSNGVNILRKWWQSYLDPTLFGYPRWATIPTDTAAMPGKQLSWKMKLTYGTRGDNEFALNVKVKLNTNYKVSMYVKTDTLIDNGLSPHGVMLWANNPNWTNVTTGLLGTNDWVEISAVINSRSNYLMSTKFSVTNCSSGLVWFSNASIREDLGNGEYGTELVELPDPEVFKHFPQLTAFKCEKIVEICEASNVWLKVVVEEKQDPVYGRILSDGSFDINNGLDGTSMYSQVGSANRTYQEYYWRFLIARYGHSSAIHSWELFNEANPDNGNHFSIANGFAKFVHDNNPNRQLVTTSTWFGFRTSEFWANPSYQDIDYMDIHQYVNTLTDFSGIINGSTEGSCIVNLGIDENSIHSFRLTPEIGEQHFCKIPVFPGHNYTVSVYTKADSLVWNGAGNPASAALWIREYTGAYGNENGFHAVNAPQNGGNYTPLTHDWTHSTVTFTADIHTHYFDISAFVTNSSSGTGWYDNITIQDNTTGKPLPVPNGNFEYSDPIYGDSSLEAYEIGSIYIGADKSMRQLRVPLIRGETGITDGNTGSELSALSNDTANLWFKKKVWAQIAPFGIIDIQWWREKLNPTRRWTIAKPYYNFMSTIPINNGNYNDIESTVSNPGIRAWGQKDLVNNKAHLWIDHAAYTWKAVVDGNNPSPISGDITMSGFDSNEYTVEFWDTSNGTISSTSRCNVAIDGNISISVDNLVSDAAVKIYPSSNNLLLPALINYYTLLRNN